ncbi:dyslexia-associated protein KIAA0319-like protein isoform X2 [Centruroides sculpturatus]|uniref:dyslexia-associated protein KIAA0319-like protein isoform X1 n=1 Tax=Centruroides sculpturatus TaxID=218467 RepID=UPI000C6CFE88|nr:dyslexia-associated protein KIAA0319-like protein isoform X1 [Centruroides sculpturatus]XP_023236917.1 dyslexia-associated protein KIAA0319-like protein isoform X1 [Centruroides sculpturatus]XP_023236918.1 dyslexia-associated protein KIAA0319-like protein isoform X2 [Centruroides sculpturatus]
MLENIKWIYLYAAIFILLPFVVHILAESETVDIQCPNFEELKIHKHVTPWGNTTAGHFTEVKEANTLTSCTMECCVEDTCNVVFFFNGTCFLIECNSKQDCQPLKRSGTKFSESYMVIVRSSTVHSTDEDYRWDDDDFRSFRSLKTPLFTNSPRNIKSQTSEYLNSREDSSQTLKPTAKKIKTCIYGIGIDCPTHEHCKPKNHRARQGLCYCDDGYIRNENSGKCIPFTASSTNISSNQIKQNSTDTPSILSSTTPPIQHLVVSAGDNKVIQLPENEVTLSAYAIAKPKEGETYNYEWSLLSHPDGDETGIMQDQNTPTLKLSKLRAGVYTFRVTVTGTGALGEAQVNVTVLPPKRKNKPPVAVIQPANATVKLPNKDTVLDGSFSTDDDKIVQYHWEAVVAPIGYAVQSNEAPTLQLKNLMPGFYKFKLTVKDSDGVLNSTIANLTVLKEMDYPPTANAGPDVIINIPQNSVILNGNLSTDDKGIKSWEWTKSPDTDKPVDMEGTTSPYLHLSHLEVGVYKFILKITDTADQMSETEVHVFVKPESNTPPVADAGPNQEVKLPLSNPIILNGNNSKDDIKISSWHWDQIVGPKLLKIDDSNTSYAKIKEANPGEYKFKLTVCDEKQTCSSAETKVNVIQTANAPPQANAGGDRTVYLPCDVVMMNGNQSSDDVGIVSYKWVRDQTSLAAGDVIENSDNQSVLKLINMIPGRYLFRLIVTDSQGASAIDTASLIVKDPSNLMDQVEIVLNADMKSYTQGQQDTLLKQLELLIREGDSVHVRLLRLHAGQESNRVTMIFVVERTSPSGQTLLVPGTEVVSRLKKKLKTNNSLLETSVLSIDTVVCQNQCSGKGSCDSYTKRCICKTFWMEDFLRVHFGDKESNCDWSVLYVIIVPIIILMAIVAVLWGIASFCNRMSFRKPKKKHKYMLLEELSDKDNRELLPQVKTQRSSLLMSDSESDALFDLRRKPSFSNIANGHTKPINGLVKDLNKVTA